MATSLALFLALAALAAFGPRDTTPRSEAMLVSDVAWIRAGEPFTVGLHVTLERGWRTPWKNAGDVGSGFLAPGPAASTTRR